MNLITFFYVPLVLIGMYYLRISTIGSLMVGMGMLWSAYGLYRNYPKEELLPSLFIIMIGMLAYFINHPLSLKLYPLLLSLLFLIYFVRGSLKRAYPLIGWVERIKKRPLSADEKVDIIRSHSFWIGVLLLNTLIHLVLVIHSDIKVWAAYAFAGWYLLFAAAIVLQIAYVHRIVLLRVLRSIWGYGLFAGVIIAGFIPAVIAYILEVLKKGSKPYAAFQRVASAMFHLFFLWAPGGGNIQMRLNPKVDTHRHYIYVATHESWIDYPLMGSFVWDLFHLTNKKNAFVWIIRPVARLLGVTDAIGHNALYPLLQCLRSRSNVLIFPEGSRSVDGSIGTFKPGAFALSIAANVPVVPVVIDGTRTRVAKGSYLWSLRAEKAICIDFLEPMSALEGESAETFSRRVWEAMRDNKERLNRNHEAAATVKKS